MKMSCFRHSWYMISARVVLVALLVVWCAGTAMSQAQSNAADLQGVVHDANGAVVSNATVMARNKATNLSRDATTNDDGYYKILNLPPGEYEVTVKANNYKTAILSSITVTVGQTANQDVALELGEVTWTVP